MPYFCYLLKSNCTINSVCSYVGFTTNPRRRLRQHNGEIKAGARKTSSKRPWVHIAVVSGFSNKVVALMFEWQWQHPKASRIVRDQMKHIKTIGKGYKGQLQVLRAMLLTPLWSQLELQVNFVDISAQSYFLSLGAMTSIRYDALSVTDVDDMHVRASSSASAARSAIGHAVEHAREGESESVRCHICSQKARASTRMLWCCPDCGAAAHVVCSALQALQSVDTSSEVLLPDTFCCSECKVCVKRIVASKMSFSPSQLQRLSEPCDATEDEEDEDDESDPDTDDEAVIDEDEEGESEDDGVMVLE